MCVCRIRTLENYSSNLLGRSYCCGIQSSSHCFLPRVVSPSELFLVLHLLLVVVASSRLPSKILDEKAGKLGAMSDTDWLVEIEETAAKISEQKKNQTLHQKQKRGWILGFTEGFTWLLQELWLGPYLGLFHVRPLKSNYRPLVAYNICFLIHVNCTWNTAN